MNNTRAKAIRKLTGFKVHQPREYTKLKNGQIVSNTMRRRYKKIKSDHTKGTK